MSGPVRLAHPRIPETAQALIRDVLSTGRLTSGECVDRLEERLSRRLEGRHVVLVSSGTTAALVAFHLLAERGIGRILMPDFLFPSMASAALRAGLEPVVADIEPERLGLAPEAIDRLPPGARAAVVSVDQFGIPGFAAQMGSRAAAASLPWFEDAACALGSVDDEGHPCATRSDLSILSFHPRKTLTTAEGGAVVTSDVDLAGRARLLRNLGVSGQGTQRRFEMAGYNARMSEVHAAIGLAQEAIFDELLDRRRRLGRRYLERLGGLARRTGGGLGLTGGSGLGGSGLTGTTGTWGSDLTGTTGTWSNGLTVPSGFSHPGCNFQSLVVLLPDGVLRDGVVRRLAAEGIESTLPGFSIKAQPVFAQIPEIGTLEHSRRLQDRGLALPLHERMEEDDVDFVCEALSRALAAGK